MEGDAERSFDKMKDLYVSDPEAFDVYRKKLIDDEINKISDPIRRQRLRGLQFQLDNKLRKFKDPVARMNAMVSIFWKQVYKFKNMLNNPQVVNDKPRVLAPVVNIKNKS